MLPAHIGIIMLSATVPNVVEFAEWTGYDSSQIDFQISDCLFSDLTSQSYQEEADVCVQYDVSTSSAGALSVR